MADLSDLTVLQTVKRVNLFSLFTSGSTLVCCALPATMVAIGSAAALSSLISMFPQLIWLSEYKVWVFGLAGAMLVIAGYLQWKSRKLPCPVDKSLAEICASTRRNALYVYDLSVAIYAIGAFFAFIAPLLI